MICSTPRTGSTLLGRVLAASGLFGSSVEYLHHKHLGNIARRFNIVEADGNVDLPTYFSRLYAHRTSANGVFGIKCHYDQFAPFVAGKRWMQILPDVKFVYIIRQDILAQAISLTIATQTNSFRADIAGTKEANYSREQIQKWIHYIADLNRHWRIFFGEHGIRPYYLTYEDFVARPQEISVEIGKYVGVDVGDALFSAENTTMKKQRDSISDIWKERFLSEG